MFGKQRGIYLDSGAFTPLNKKAYKAMCVVLKEQVAGTAGNPLSSHAVGRRARQYIRDAATHIAQVEEMKAENIVFTSGATEAIQIALRTPILAHLQKGRPLHTMHILAGAEEHSAVYRLLDHFKQFGLRYTCLDINEPFTPETVLPHITEDTIAFTMQYVNNSHGRIFPVAKVADTVRKRNPDIFLHADAAQASSYYRCSPEFLRADAVTIDSAKSFGPQGMGALLFKNLVQYGGLTGVQEQMDMRPGTPSSALIYSFATALREVRATRQEALAYMAVRKKYLFDLLIENFPQTIIRGLDKKITDVTEKDLCDFSPHLTKVSFPGVNHLYLATLLESEGISVSTATACDPGNGKAMRIGILPTTTDKELRAFVAALKKNIPLAPFQ